MLGLLKLASPLHTSPRLFTSSPVIRGAAPPEQFHPFVGKRSAGNQATAESLHPPSSPVNDGFRRFRHPRHGLPRRTVNYQRPDNSVIRAQCSLRRPRLLPGCLSVSTAEARARGHKRTRRRALCTAPAAAVPSNVCPGYVSLLRFLSREPEAIVYDDPAAGLSVTRRPAPVSLSPRLSIRVVEPRRGSVAAHACGTSTAH